MRLSIVILLIFPLFTFGNTDTGGIQFLNNLNWKQIQEKAKKENKYIFVDCYATWCGPCREMDRNVYTNKKVADFFQSGYISVKVQMDITPGDNDTVKKWYGDAREINQAYRISAYPTLLFFNPDGEIVLKEIGFKDPNALIALASKATKPGISYDDEYKEYNLLVKAFRSGKIDLKKMAYAINISRTLNDSTLADSLTRYYETALKRLSTAELYDSTHLKYIGTHIQSSGNVFFRLFYPDGSKADKVMRQEGFSVSVVDRVIKKEYTGPSLAKASQTGISPDWESLCREISSRYPVSFADRGVLAAKLRWYQFNRIWPSYDSALITIVNKYGLSSLEIYRSLYVNPIEETMLARDATMNWFAWDRVFMIEASKESLQFALQQMPGVVERSASFNVYWAYATRDTYANLLFKSGDKQQAMKWENEALQYALELQDKDVIKNCEETIKKMSM